MAILQVLRAADSVVNAQHAEKDLVMHCSFITKIWTAQKSMHRKFRAFAKEVNYIAGLDVVRYAAQSLFRSYPKICISPKEKQRTIIFNPVVQPDYITFLYELILARQFIILGYSVIFIINDGVLAHIEHSQVSLSEYTSFYYTSWWNSTRRRTVQAAIFILGKGRIKPILLSHLIKISKNETLAEIDDNIISKYATESSIRYFESEFINRSSIFFKDSIYNATQIYRIALYLAASFPDSLLISWHHIYSCYGPLYHVFTKRGIPCRTISWTVGKIKHLRIYRSIPTHTVNDPMWIKHKHRSLLLHEKKRSEDFLSSRLDLRTSDMKNMYGARPCGRSSQDFDKYLDANPRPLIYFPNVVWDSPTENRNVLFNGLTESILYVTRFALAHSLPIVLRFHPAEETLLPKRKSLADDIIPSLGDLINHPKLFIINSSDNLNIYSYFDRIGAGLVYDGTIGYELAYHGIPIIGLGEARNCQKEWAIIPRTIEDLNKLLLDQPYRDETFFACAKNRKQYVLRHVNWALFTSTVKGDWMDSNASPPKLKNFWPNLSNDQFIKFAYLNGLIDLEDNYIASNF